jgi:hypothetical protein
MSNINDLYHAPEVGTIRGKFSYHGFPVVAVQMSEDRVFVSGGFTAMTMTEREFNGAIAHRKLIRSN